MSKDRADFEHQNRNQENHMNNNRQVPQQRNERNVQAPGPMTEGPTSEDITVVMEGTSIKGDITSNGSLDVLGTINGSIQIRGKLSVSGNVTGGSRAGHIITEGAKIRGDLVSEDEILIGTGSVIEGNISSNKAVIAGAVKGNLDIHGPVVLDATAIVLGDIKSESIMMNSGAVMEGRFSQCYAEITPESFFKNQTN